MKKVVKIVVLTGFMLGLIVVGQYSNKPDFMGQSSPESETIKA